MPKFLDDIIISGGAKLKASNASGTIHELAVTGNNTRSTLSLKSKDSSGNSVDLRMHSLEGGRGEIFTFTNHALGFATNNAAPQMLLNTSGQLGIGTASPTSKLHVVGNVAIQSDDDNRFLVRSNDYTISRIISRGNSGTNLDKGLFSLMSSDGTNNNVEQVRIDSAGASWFNGGYVGIGTTSPIVDLDIVKTANSTLRVRSDNAAKIIIDSDADNSGAAGSYLEYKDNGSTKWTLYKETNNDFYLYNATSNTYPIHAKSNGHIVLMEDGNNLGVGVSSPNSKLEVAGTIKSTVTSTTGRIRGGGAGQLHLGDDSDIISIGRTNELWSFSDVDSDQTLYVNYRGYNNGSSRFRSLDIRDGKAGQIALFNGTNKQVTFSGEVSVPGKITHVNDTNTWIGFDDGNDTFRVVTGGSERFGITNSRTRISNGDLDVEGGDFYVALAGTMQHGNYSKRQFTSGTFTNGTANLGMLLRFPNVQMQGYLKITLSNSYSNQNSTGELTKIIPFGFNPNGSIWGAGADYAVNATGPIANNFTIGDIVWNSSNSTFDIPIYHIVSTGNHVKIIVEYFGGNANQLENLTATSPASITIPTKYATKHNTRVHGAFEITGDGNNPVTFTESGSGDFTIDAPDDIRLDAGGGDVVLKDDGTEFGRLSNSSTDFVISSSTQDKDIIFKGNDGGSTITALTLDMSDGGWATFNSGIHVANTFSPSTFGKATFAGAVGIKTAAAYTANTSADELVVGNGTGHHGITIHTGTTHQGSIYFADDLDAEGAGDNPAGNRDGVLRYDQNNGHFQLRTGGNQIAATIKHNASTFAAYVDAATGFRMASGQAIDFINTNTGYNSIKRNTTLGGIQISTGGNSSMNLLDNGNVGVGGAHNPGSKFQVDNYTVGSNGSQNLFGNITSFANSGAENLVLAIKNASYPNRGWAFNPVTSGVNSDLVIQEHGLTGERLRIKSGGTIESPGIVDGDFTALRLMNQKSYGAGTGTNEKVRFAMGISESGVAFSSREGFVTEVSVQDETDSSNVNVEFKVRDGGTLGTYQTVTGSSKAVTFAGNIVMATNATVDGRDISGIPTSFAPVNADTTNATNVVAALNNNLGTVTVGDADDQINIQGNLTVTGITTMSGGTVINTTTNTAIKDTTIALNTGISSSTANVADIGLILDRGSTGNVFMGWDESEDEFIFAKTSSEGSDDAGSAVGGGVPGIVIDNEETDFLHVKVGTLESVGAITAGNSNVLTAGTAASSFPSGLQNSNVTSVSGSSGSCTGNAATATALSTTLGLTTVSMTFQLATNTWTDTGIDGTDLATGTYAMQVYVDDHYAGGGHFDEYYSATISWYSGSTNSTNHDEIVLHRAGHASNASHLQVRTLRASNSDTHDLMLQVKQNFAHSLALNGTDGKRMIFKFRRLI